MTDYIHDADGVRYVRCELFSEAITEVYELRAALAYEADVRRADLELKSYPKSRRQIAEAARERMTNAARGYRRGYFDQTGWPKHALRAAGARDTMSNDEWVQQQAEAMRPGVSR